MNSKEPHDRPLRTSPLKALRVFSVVSLAGLLGVSTLAMPASAAKPGPKAATSNISSDVGGQVSTRQDANCTVTYAVDAREWIAAGDDPRILEVMVDRAFQSWSTATGWQFEQISWPGLPVVDLEANWFGWPVGVDIPVVSVADASSTGIHRSFKNPRVASSAGLGSGVAVRSGMNFPFLTLQSVVVHEIGHALGLTHKDEPAAIMASTIDSQVDLAALLSTYSVNVPDDVLRQAYCGEFRPAGVRDLVGDEITVDVASGVWDVFLRTSKVVTLMWHQGRVLVGSEVSANDGFETFGLTGDEVNPVVSLGGQQSAGGKKPAKKKKCGCCCS